MPEAAGRLRNAIEHWRGETQPRGERSVSQIAIDNGFTDLSHFSRAFRGRFGASPRDYRNALQAQA